MRMLSSTLIGRHRRIFVEAMSSRYAIIAASRVREEKCSHGGEGRWEGCGKRNIFRTHLNGRAAWGMLRSVRRDSGGWWFTAFFHAVYTLLSVHVCHYYYHQNPLLLLLLLSTSTSTTIADAEITASYLTPSHADVLCLAEMIRAAFGRPTAKRSLAKSRRRTRFIDVRRD